MALRRSTFAMCFLLMMQSALSLALQQMTPEEEAAYRDMIKRQGGDPDEAMRAMKMVENMHKWSGAQVIHYNIVGVYQGKTMITGEGGDGLYGDADVTDRVVIDLDWNPSDKKLVGTPSIQNSKSTLNNLRNPEPSCLPPIIPGAYDHYELLSIKNGRSEDLELQIQRNWPEMKFAQFCTGSYKTTPAGHEMQEETMTLLDPVLFSMEIPADDDLRISEDEKSLIHKEGNWTWTFTPSVAAK